MNVLSESDLKFFDDNGYIRIRNIVPQENITAVVDAIHEFLSIARQKDDSWYQPPIHPTGMVEMFQHQAMWSRSVTIWGGSSQVQRNIVAERVLGLPR